MIELFAMGFIGLCVGVVITFVIFDVLYIRFDKATINQTALKAFYKGEGALVLYYEPNLPPVPKTNSVKKFTVIKGDSK